jgi:hypothetical protein
MVNLTQAPVAGPSSDSAAPQTTAPIAGSSGVRVKQEEEETPIPRRNKGKGRVRTPSRTPLRSRVQDNNSEVEYESAMEDNPTVHASSLRRLDCDPSPDLIFTLDNTFVRQMTVLQSSFLSLAASFDRLERRGRYDHPREPNRSSLKDPETFSGEEPEKLKEFLSLCRLHFSKRPETYASDGSRILYVMSYLRGDAHHWFTADEHDDGTLPYWDGDFAAFVAELRGNFGPTDSVGDAKTRITQLRMKSNKSIVKYMVRFNCLASQLSWGNAALCHQFYRGLSDRLKDDLIKIDYENILLGLRVAAQKLDQRYWVRDLEKRREHHDPESSRSSGRPRPRPSNSRPSTSSNQFHSSNATASSYRTSNSTSSKPRPAYANKLGSDGKIMQSEKDRCKKEGLCMYCRGKGHIAVDCKKRPSEASGKASKAKSVPSPVKADSEK